MSSMKVKSDLRKVRANTAILAVTTIALGCSSLAFAQNEDKVKAGMELWKGSGCSDCHGAFANGERERDESPAGADLRSPSCRDACLFHEGSLNPDQTLGEVRDSATASELRRARSTPSSHSLRISGTEEISFSV